LENKKVLLGMSGGVDSSVSALLLKNQGYEVIGVTMKLWDGEEEESTCCGFEATNDAKRICDQIGVAHYTINEMAEFNKYVINDFICSYAKCKTPNPCIECNKYLKFGSMYNLAKQLDAEYIATGHYAKTEYSEKYGRIVLKKSASEKKDQSYVLYSINKEVLPHLIFPLAEFEDKEEIRKIARENNLRVANKPDSEDICFIPDGDYKRFLEENSDLSPKAGNIVDKQGNILGKHNGLYRYTIGQRKGLGISHPTPLFVLGFNSEKNEVIVGEQEELFQSELNVEEINLLAIDEITDGMEVQTKIRYAAKPVCSSLYKNEDGTVKVVFKEKVRGATPGQSAVFYDDDIVIGGGKICQ
jgi:tRNA-specific 2-thiouridylase